MNSVRGLREWIIQRLSAIFMALYLVVLCAYFAFHPDFNYESWKGFFHLIWVEVATVLFMLGMLWHTWIGVWTIITDYIKWPVTRMVVQTIVLLLLFAYFIWGVAVVLNLPIFWSLI